MDCKICFEPKCSSEMTTLDCGHFFCTSCIISIIRVATESYSVGDIVCPALNCRKKMSKDNIVECLKSHAQSETLLKFEKVCNDRQLILNPSLLQCTNIECKNMIRMNESKIVRKFYTCDMCRTEICGRCRLSNHSSNECLVDINDNFADLKKDHILGNCPNCKVSVEKESGCNHMTCYICKYNFCWLCRRKYTPNHYLSFNLIFGCPDMQKITPKDALKTRVISILLSIAMILIFSVAVYAASFFWNYILNILRILVSYILAAFVCSSNKKFFTSANFILMTASFYLYIDLFLKILLWGSLLFVVTICIHLSVIQLNKLRIELFSDWIRKNKCEA
jgi:hypothetical protein